MSKLTDSFHEVGVHNAWEFYGRGTPFIAYRPQEGVFGSRWQVVRPGFKTDPSAHWSDHGYKTFTVFGQDGATHARKKELARGEAEEWASERYGINEWKKDPFGSYGEASFIDARIRELKTAVKAQRPFVTGKGQKEIADE